MKRPLWLTLSSALLIVASFPPWNLSSLIWICLIPWLFALSQTIHWKHALKQGFLLSIFTSFFGFYWVASVLHEFGALPWVLSILGFLLFSLVGQIQFICIAPLVRLHLRSTLMMNILAFTLIYTGADWILPKLFKDTLGHALFSAPHLRQLADIGGAHLLTALVCFTNITLFHLIRTRGKVQALLIPLTTLTVVLTASFLYGIERRNEINRHLDHPIFSAQGAAIQANIGDFDKVAAEQGIVSAADKVLKTYLSLSDRAINSPQKPDFLVWPETAYPSTFRTPNNTAELARDHIIESYIQTRKIPLLFGGYDHLGPKEFNALFLLTPSLNPFLSSPSDLQTYRKNILLLFGEYLPGAEEFEFIRDQFPQVGNFGRGAGPELLSIPIPRAPLGHIKTGPVICYEALFPEYVLEAARKGSQLILNITNDSWFGPYGEPPLHLALVTFRSIESRLPQLRATNTGISALILPNGDIVEPTRLGEKDVLHATIPIIETIPTLIKKWGDWFGPFALILGVLISFIIQFKTKKAD